MCHTRLVFPKCSLSKSRTGWRERARVEEMGEGTKQLCRAGFRLIFLDQEQSNELKHCCRFLGHILLHQDTGSSTNNAPFLLQNLLLQNHKHVIL